MRVLLPKYRHEFSITRWTLTAETLQFYLKKINCQVYETMYIKFGHQTHFLYATDLLWAEIFSEPNKQNLNITLGKRSQNFPPLSFCFCVCFCIKATRNDTDNKFIRKSQCKVYIFILSVSNALSIKILSSRFRFFSSLRHQHVSSYNQH